MKTLRAPYRCSKSVLNIGRRTPLGSRRGDWLLRRNFALFCRLLVVKVCCEGRWPENTLAANNETSLQTGKRHAPSDVRGCAVAGAWPGGRPGLSSQADHDRRSGGGGRADRHDLAYYGPGDVQ